VPRKKKDPDELKSERIRVAVTKRMRDRIRGTARLLEMSDSAFIAMCVREWLDKPTRRSPPPPKNRN